MRRARIITVILLASGLIGRGLTLAQSGSRSHGPEVQSFLDLMRHEEDELEFQIRHNEITRKQYTRSKSCIAIQRQTVLSIERESGEDNVPEIHVVAVDELDQLIVDGSRLLKTLKRGEIINGRWEYLGSVTRGELFYIFERLANK